ncbi:uncharacterized protein LOC129939055 [Eupeodes corollae]|uniref:uncharacterized protein LOC129939055 n=1 Tax=Eupeodes corollae TaxID=290404 RepID=UPI002492C693|nr:uncharacterized protein LOC129939055 [Eupeodes corollae]
MVTPPPSTTAAVMAVEVLKITKPAQFERLIDVLQQKPELARGKGQFGSTKRTQDEEWENIAVQLNIIGPPSRTAKEWQRVWIHYKGNLKRKLANNKLNLKTTGGGTSQHITLTNLEESVVGLIELQKSVNPTGTACGLYTLGSSFSPYLCSNGDDDNFSPPEEENVSASTSFSRKAKKRKPLQSIEEERIGYLKTQTENHTQMLQLLKNIENTNYKNYSLNKQKLELKKKSIELKKKKCEEASELHALNVQIKKRKI